LKKLIKISLVIFVLLAIAIGSIGYYFYNNIKPILVKEINKTLAVEVNVQDISISGIKDFPKLGVKFSDISINESTSFYKTQLLQAEELNLFVDVLKLYKGEYVIDAITLRDGYLSLADLKGGSNYDILKPSNNNDSSAVSFEIKDLTIVNCKLTYTHSPSNFDCKSYTTKSKIKLKYLDNATDLRIKTALDNMHLNLDGEAFINNQNLQINTWITVKTDKEQVLIAESDVIIQDVALKTKGSVSYGETNLTDITFNSNKTNAQSLISVLPQSIASSFEHIKLDGDLAINGFFKGRMDQGYNPSFGFDYSLSNTTLSIPTQNISLNGISASGLMEIPDISNLKSAKATCNLKRAKSDNNSITGNISVLNFNKPKINWNGKANLDASFVFALSDSSNFNSTSGTIISDGKLTFVYDPEIEDIASNSLVFEGKIFANHIVGQLADPALDVKDLTLDLSADNSKMVINSANINYNETKATLVGYIENYHTAFGSNSKAKLVGKLEVDHLVVNELYGSETEGEPEPSSSNYISPIAMELNSTLTHFKYNDFTADKMTGMLLSDRNEITMPNCKIKALDGTTTASLNLKNWGENYLLDINSDVKDIDITQLFKQFNNFEQEEITDQHLSGRLTGKILTKVILDPKYEPILSKLYAKANIKIKNGELKGYEPLKELSSFVHISNLENVRFKTLSNTIEIFDETIFIPKMRIENSAINLSIEGNHTFENRMYYQMELSVAELLATKANWIAKKKERRIEQNKDGGLTAYIIMEGTPDDLKIRYDRASAIENFKDEVEKEKSNFIKALKGEGTLDDDDVETKDYDNVWDE
jgi:hypothetical protein